MITKRTIFVQFQKEGIHRYPDAPEGVKFLRHDHRHMFYFRAEIGVVHNDRDIEFILLKRELESLYDNDVLILNHKSCEMMAEDLYKYIQTHYPDRDVTITVSEDGENGATLRWEAE